MKPIPPDIQWQIDSILTAIRTRLGKDLIGVYLHGSLAMGCFNPNASDLDLLVVFQNPLPIATQRELAADFLALSRQPAPIEISFLALGDLHPWQHPTRYQFHYSESWRERYKAGEWEHLTDRPKYDSDLAAHITVTRQRGIVLIGKPIDEVFPLVPKADYLDSILSDLPWALERIEEYPVYGVLNHCRVLGYIQTGQVFSKTEGAEWALTTLPKRDHDIIRQALLIYSGDPVSVSWDYDRIRELCLSIQRQINETLKRSSLGV